MRASAVLAAAAVLALATGCQNPVVPSPVPSPSVQRTEVSSGGDARSGAAVVRVGQTVRLSLGEYNASVGDSWGVLTNSADGVADAEIRTVSVQANPAPGSPSNYYLDLTGRSAGATVVELRYCYRSALAADCDQGPNPGAAHANVKVEVTVG